MRKFYKSTIVIYSEDDWSKGSLYDLIVDATVVGQAGGSICSTWHIEEIGENDLSLDVNSKEIIEFFDSSDDFDDDYENDFILPDDVELDPDPYEPYTEDDYEFYDDEQ